MTTEPEETSLSEEFDGCNSACRRAGQHVMNWGGCEYAKPPEPIMNMLILETADDGENSIVVRQLPVKAWEQLITVAKWVSRGKSAAFTPDPDIAPAYPDAAARFALGALHDAGLLNTENARQS